jgi:ribose/xylose/arabinose/galactoside ABC-type transport system permease subunit
MNDQSAELAVKPKYFEKVRLADFSSIIGLVLLVIISAILSPTFLKPINLMNVIIQISSASLVAIGMTFVILSGGIDLSVGSVVAFCGVTVALAAPLIGLWPAVVFALIIGILIGALHGLFITYFHLPPFISTLGGLTIYRGLALVITKAAAIPITDRQYDIVGSSKIGIIPMVAIAAIVAAFKIAQFILSLKSMEKHAIKRKLASLVVFLVILAGFTYLGIQVKGLSVQIAIALVIMAVFTFILNKTVLGREIYALGGNVEAARLAGIKTDQKLMIIYSISGFLAALSGVMVSARLASGTPQVANGGELDAIAATVIGGTSFSGGIGKISGTIIGVLLIGVLNNLLSLMNVSSDLKSVFKGLIIIVAVTLDMRLRKR